MSDYTVGRIVPVGGLSPADDMRKQFERVFGAPGGRAHRMANLPPADPDPDATYTCPNCNGTGEIDGHGHMNSVAFRWRENVEEIRKEDREAIAKAAQEWAEPRMGSHTARQLADFIRGSQ